MSWRRVVLILGGLLFLVVVWLGRYELVEGSAGGTGSGAVVYRLDRWSGRVLFIVGDEAMEVKVEPKASTPP